MYKRFPASLTDEYLFYTSVKLIRKRFYINQFCNEPKKTKTWQGHFNLFRIQIWNIYIVRNDFVRA